MASSCCGHICRARMLFAAYSLCNSLNYRHRGGQWEEGRKHVCWPGSLLSSYSSPTLSSCACWAPAAVNVYNLEEPQLNQNWNFKRRERKQAAFLTVCKRLIYSPFIEACLIKKKKKSFLLRAPPSYLFFGPHFSCFCSIESLLHLCPALHGLKHYQLIFKTFSFPHWLFPRLPFILERLIDKNFLKVEFLVKLSWKTELQEADWHSEILLEIRFCKVVMLKMLQWFGLVWFCQTYSTMKRNAGCRTAERSGCIVGFNRSFKADHTVIRAVQS